MKIHLFESQSHKEGQKKKNQRFSIVGSCPHGYNSQRWARLKPATRSLFWIPTWVTEAQGLGPSSIAVLCASAKELARHKLALYGMPASEAVA